jgi:hypothetical protein
MSVCGSVLPIAAMRGNRRHVAVPLCGALHRVERPQVRAKPVGRQVLGEMLPGVMSMTLHSQP